MFIFFHYACIIPCLYDYRVKLFKIDKKYYILVDSSDSMVKLKCPRCGHVWEYKGCLVFATCPSCYKKIDVREFREVESNAGGGGM